MAEAEQERRNAVARYQVMPPLSDEEYQALKESIREKGILEPVLMDTESNIIDGHHRVRAADELTAEGLSVHIPIERKHGLSAAEKMELAYTLNTTRRHLTKEWKQQEAAKLRQEGWTQVRIGTLLGVPKSTIGRWLNELSQMGKLDEPDTIVGADGKVRKATYERTQDTPQTATSPPVQEPEPERTPRPIESHVEEAEEGGGNTSTNHQSPTISEQSRPRQKTPEQERHEDEVKDRWDRFIYLVFYAKKVDPDLVKWLYRELAREYHPDKHQNDPSERQERCAQAFAFITDIRTFLEGDEHEVRELAEKKGIKPGREA